MADIEAGEFRGGRRVDRVTAGAVVVTVDAVLLLTVAVVGIPFLMFVFGDEDGTWHRLWPLVTQWVVAVGLGVACAVVAYRFTWQGNPAIRRAGAAAALATAVVSGVVVGVYFPGVLAVVGALFAVANVAAALALTKAKDETVAEPRPTVELAPPAMRPEPKWAEPHTVRRSRPRGRPAMQTMAGVRLPRRAKRTRPANKR